MKTYEEPCVLERIDLRQCGGSRYALLRLRAERLTVFAVYAERGRESAFELLGGDKALAENAFGQIVEGELSPLHLYDWTRDIRYMWEKMRILES